MTRAGAFAVGAAALAAGVAACGGGTQSTIVPCTPESGNICTIAGTGTAGDGADHQAALRTNLYSPQDMTVGPDGRLFIVDWNNHRIRVLEPDDTLSIVAGIGELGVSIDDPTTNRLNHQTNVTFDSAGNLVIAAWHNSRIKTVDLSTCGANRDYTSCDITDMCGNGMRAFSGDGGPAAAAALNLPVAVVFNAQQDLIIADQANNRLRMVAHDTGIITTIAGTAPCADATDPSCTIGDGGPATAARFSFPAGQAAQPGGRIDITPGGEIYVADTSDARVRKIDTAGIVTTIAGIGQYGYAGDGGPGTEATLSNVSDVAVAPDGSVYVADTGNDCVRVIGTDGIINTAVGVCGHTGFSGDGGPAASALLARPTGVAFDAKGDLFIADSHNQRVRVVYK